MIRDFSNEEQCAGETKPILMEEADCRQSRINDHSLGAHLSRSSDQSVDQKFGNLRFQYYHRHLSLLKLKLSS
jgi:hypothetical protein